MEEAELPFRLSEHIPNSRAALRVTELARDAGMHEALHDRLMHAYWGEAEDIGDRDVLRRHAVAAGLDADEVDDVLGSDRYLDRVTASTQEAVSIGVTGVPAFLIDGRLLVLGAQPEAVFERAFGQLEQIGGENPEAQRRRSRGRSPLHSPHPPWVGHEPMAEICAQVCQWCAEFTQRNARPGTERRAGRAQRAAVRKPGRTSLAGACRPASRTGGLTGSASGAAPNDARTRDSSGAP